MLTQWPNYRGELEIGNLAIETNSIYSAQRTADIKQVPNPGLSSGRTRVLYLPDLVADIIRNEK
jgi:hypothetical protein